MKQHGADATVLDRLEWALETGSLPKAAREYALHLVGRLSQPVRVSLLGTPGSGKSQLANMFMGAELIPDDTDLPTTEYTYGPSPQMIVTGTDGAVIKVHGHDVSMISGRRAAFLRLELPIPILQRINLLEVVTDGSQRELNAGVDWVVRRTDIALWCTQEFGKPEQDIWRRVPDSLKDHAFLVLTKADEISAQHELSKRISSLETVVAEEFHSMFAVATLQAIAAQVGKKVDETAFHASGGGGLTAEVLRHAERGRRADFDSAHMFLARYNIGKLGEAGQSSARRPSGARPISAAPEAPPLRAVSEPRTAPQAEPDQKPGIPQTPAPQPQPASQPKPKVANVTLYTDAVRFLKRRGDTLSETAATLGDGQAHGLIDNCVSAVEHLTDMFSESDVDCDMADAFVDELYEAQDLMVLMQVEEGDGPAADAVTLLLQLRRDLEMQLAA